MLEAVIESEITKPEQIVPNNVYFCSDIDGSSYLFKADSDPKCYSNTTKFSKAIYSECIITTSSGNKTLIRKQSIAFHGYDPNFSNANRKCRNATELEIAYLEYCSGRNTILDLNGITMYSINGILLGYEFPGIDQRANRMSYLESIIHILDKYDDKNILVQKSKYIFITVNLGYFLYISKQKCYV